MKGWEVHIARISGHTHAADLDEVCARAYQAGASTVVVDIEVDHRRVAEFRTEDGRFAGFAAEVQS